MIYGKKDTHNGYEFDLFLNLATKNKDIKLFGKGEEKRDHVYIDDLINVLKCIERMLWELQSCLRKCLLI